MEYDLDVKEIKRVKAVGGYYYYQEQLNRVAHNYYKELKDIFYDRYKIKINTVKLRFVGNMIYYFFIAKGKGTFSHIQGCNGVYLGQDVHNQKVFISKIRDFIIAFRHEWISIAIAKSYS